MRQEAKDGVAILQEVAQEVSHYPETRSAPRVIERQHGYRKENRRRTARNPNGHTGSPKAYTSLTADDIRVFLLRGWRVRSRAHGVHILPR